MARVRHQPVPAILPEGNRGEEPASQLATLVEADLWIGGHGVAATVAQATNSHPEEVAKQAVADTLTGRFTHPQEVADPVALLASVIGPATSPTPTSSSTEG